MKTDLLTSERRRNLGSFRDPDGFVFQQGDHVYRAVFPAAAPRWHQFVASGLADQLQSAGLLVPTHDATDHALLEQFDLPEGTIVLEHERVPFLSYPYEWTFAMLRDAALLHLEIMERALANGWILKDATAYNVLFRGVQPLFIDVLSFVPLEQGEPWTGYNQFCRMMLYPLMLESYKHVPFQPWLRSELEGIDPILFGRMFHGWDRIRPGVLTHVKAQAYLQRHFASTAGSIRQQIKSANMSVEMIARNVRGLKKIVTGLSLPKENTTWSDYSRAHYQGDALAQKEDFVRSALAGRPLPLVWDLGCNDGHFSRIAAQTAHTVVAMDFDAGSINRLYCDLRAENTPNLLPLLMNLANPSPAQGWASTERASLLQRGKPDLTLVLALVHHIVISSNVPLKVLLEWLGSLTRELVVEFIDKKDPMVQRLLLNKDDTYSDYRREAFENYLLDSFEVQRIRELAGGTRVLYHATSLRDPDS